MKTFFNSIPLIIYIQVELLFVLSLFSARILVASFFRNILCAKFFSNNLYFTFTKTTKPFSTLRVKQEITTMLSRCALPILYTTI